MLILMVFIIKLDKFMLFCSPTMNGFTSKQSGWGLKFQSFFWQLVTLIPMRLISVD